MADDTLDWLLRQDVSGALPGDLIRRLLAGDPPLVTGLRSPEDQVQPNGLDLTLAEVHRFVGAGRITIDNAARRLPETEPLDWGEDDIVLLAPGPYHIVYNEIVHIPLNAMALGRPRSTLARCGASIHTAVWDAGYRGRSTSLLIVENGDGIELQRNARVMQLVFFSLASAASQGYAGRYQGENIKRG